MSTPARAWHATSALVVVVALVIQVPITAAATGGAFDTPAARVANLFTFFTILTNLLVALTGVALALAPRRRSTLLSVLRLDAVLGITVTGIVFHTLLADLADLRGAEAFADLLFHTVSPIVVVLGWLLFGPRGLIDRRAVLLSLLYPLLWLGFTLVRGAVIDWYPYPFVDVSRLGYPTVLLNSLGITALFLVLAAALLGVDRVLARRADARSARIGS
ncbi:Pr6Pr family membrane protein [Pseudonocardia abyssalis]|jgi:hypothetical protein|uniref:Pr6Pr family membrane protein n=1 Tax=Pseudonocardia abyssalis TaxID=2792008 RepID=A0ABS6UP52_9PSEU|nr:Pr6Pr family membrane protein [Pseudonocardia abyssalis]MBW0119250.1 Pr6Pr family membrane protein [Pseudonocardia abyssalis]MBW0134033.1 Pr6Pr family membrane protein [Pseudonocardia abyssalis]